MRFAASLVSPHQAADLVSEVMVATLKKRSLTSLENPQAYLMQAVLNRARSNHRRMSRERETQPLLAMLPRRDDPTADFVVGDEVVRAVAELPIQQRAAIYLVYWVGHDPKEAAALLGVQPGTARRYLHLAREKLRRYLDE